MLSLFGMVLFLVAAVDACGRLLGWPLTDYSWSPAIFAALGFALVTLEALEHQTSPSGRSGSPRQGWAGAGALGQPSNPALRSTEG